MRNLSDYDVRQYSRMIKVLRYFDDGKLPLDVVASQLEGLLSALENPDQDVRQELSRNWGVFNDLASAGTESELDQVSLELLRTASAALHRLITSQLENSGWDSEEDKPLDSD